MRSATSTRTTSTTASGAGKNAARMAPDSDSGVHPGPIDVVGSRGCRAATRKRLLTDDLRLERSEDPEQLALFLGRHVELVERLDEILDQRVEIGVGDAHALVRRLHVLAGIRAGTSRGLADLVDKVAFQAR